MNHKQSQHTVTVTLKEIGGGGKSYSSLHTVTLSEHVSAHTTEQMVLRQVVRRHFGDRANFKFADRDDGTFIQVFIGETKRIGRTLQVLVS